MIFNVTTTKKLLSHTSAITWEKKHLQKPEYYKFGFICIKLCLFQKTY